MLAVGAGCGCLGFSPAYFSVLSHSLGNGPIYTAIMSKGPLNPNSNKPTKQTN